MLDFVESMRYRFEENVGYDLFGKVKRIHARRSTPEWQRLFAADFPDYQVDRSITDGHSDWARNGGSIVGAPHASLATIEALLGKLNQGRVAGADGTDVDWRFRGPYVGRRLRIGVDDDVVYGTVVAYLPAGETADDMALWKVMHDDCDCEDREQAEVQSCLTRDKKLYLTPLQLGAGGAAAATSPAKATASAGVPPDDGAALSGSRSDRGRGSGKNAGAPRADGPRTRAPSVSTGVQDPAVGSAQASVSESVMEPGSSLSTAYEASAAGALGSVSTNEGSRTAPDRRLRTSSRVPHLPLSTVDGPAGAHRSSTKQQIVAQSNEAEAKHAEQVSTLRHRLVQTCEGWNIEMLQVSLRWCLRDLLCMV
jgi:hypothetical protein